MVKFDKAWLVAKEYEQEYKVNELQLQVHNQMIILAAFFSLTSYWHSCMETSRNVYLLINF